MIRRSQRSGFTLLELILASAIMASLALTLYSAMRVGFRARDRVLAAVGPARSGEIAMNLIRRDLESALPPTGLIAGPFLGQGGTDVSNSSSVMFYAVGREPQPVTSLTGASSATPPQDPTAAGSVVRVELALRSPSTGSGGLPLLVRRVTTNLLAATEPEPVEEILCRDVTTFTVRYFDGTQWHDDWDSTQFGDTIPMAVEVTLELLRPNDPTRAMTDVATDPSNVSKYTATRTFLLPCRNEQVLLQGGTQQ